jgi:peptide/nickel transport system permease protein
VTRYTVRRIGQAIATLIVSSFIVFAIVHVLPGNAANAIAGADATHAEIKAITDALGLNQPLPVQYWDWVWQLLHGNFGSSFVYHTPVWTLISSRLPWSLVLATSALVLAVIIGVPLGIVAATRPGGLTDTIVSGVSAVMIGVPGMVFGILVIYVFAVESHLLPVSGAVSPSQNFGLAVKSLILPSCALAIESPAGLLRFTRSTVREALDSPFIQTAKAKGAKQGRVLFGHALPSIGVPLITVLGVHFGRTIAGAVVIEQVFAWPGIGLLLIDAINDRDYVLIQGCMLMILIVFLLINLITDLLYAVVDPRVRIRPS